jgi:hypothetical protein
VVLTVLIAIAAASYRVPPMPGTTATISATAVPTELPSLVSPSERTSATVSTRVAKVAPKAMATSSALLAAATTTPSVPQAAGGGEADLVPTAVPTPALVADPGDTPRATVPPETPSTAAAPHDSEPGVLVVKAKPPGFSIMLDGVPQGRVERVPISAGTHRIVITHPEYLPLNRVIRIGPGETRTLVVDLKDEAVRRKQ